jgi:hypothetical protein
MKRSVCLWILAFALTAASAVYQRMTGPTYPVRGTLTVEGTTFKYRLVRSLSLGEPAVIPVATGDPAIQGRLEWRRHRTADDWTAVAMQYADGRLSAEVPKFPAAAKIQYRIFLRKAAQATVLPAGGPVVLRFKGDVPLWVLVIHVIVIFGAMLFSTRTGLEYFNPEPLYRRWTLWTIVFLTLGGMLLGPVVQKYAFDAYWTGWPFGQDLTDNKTAVALLGWIVTAARLRGRRAGAWVLGAAVLTLVVFMIPHSVLGSEFDYNQAR